MHNKYYLYNAKIIGPLGIMPNIAADWSFIWTVEIIVNRANKDFTSKLL